MYAPIGKQALLFCVMSVAGIAVNADAVTQIQTNEEFTALVENNPRKLLAFDLYADWCAPCRMLAPTLVQVAAENAGTVTFYKINVDRLPDISRLFGVSNIPLVVFVKNRRTVYAVLGLQSKEVYVRAINTYSVDSGGETAAQAKDTLRSLSFTQAKDIIARRKPLILDVRTPGEYAGGHLLGARLIPLADLAGRLSEIADFKATPVLVYCRSGNRSAAAGEILIKNGFHEVYNLQHGIADWEKNNGAVITDSK